MNIKLPKVVAFVGPIGCGKTTATHFLEHLGYRKVSFADPLKQMLSSLGLTTGQLWGSEKETEAHILCGRTPRHAMQTLGTEWGRQLIHPDLWVRAWQFRCQEHQLVTVDDLRFPNELAAVRSMNGVVVKIIRPGVQHDPSHESEAHTLRHDCEVFNAGTLDHFRRNVLLTVQAVY